MGREKPLVIFFPCICNPLVQTFMCDSRWGHIRTLGDRHARLENATSLLFDFVSTTQHIERMGKGMSNANVIIVFLWEMNCFLNFCAPSTKLCLVEIYFLLGNYMGFLKTENDNICTLKNTKVCTHLSSFFVHCMYNHIFCTILFACSHTLTGFTLMNFLVILMHKWETRSGCIWS